MNYRPKVLSCMLFAVLQLCIAICSVTAAAQAGIPVAEMEYPSGTLAVGYPITFTCESSETGGMPQSYWINDITVTGPDSYSSVGGSALSGLTSGTSTYVTTLPYAGSYSAHCLGGIAESNVVTFTVAAYSQNILYPAYQIISLIYAPPGNKSQDGYTDTTTNGTTTMIGSSFTEGGSITFTEGITAFGDVYQRDRSCERE